MSTGGSAGGVDIVQEVKTVFTAEMGALRREMSRIASAARQTQSPLDRFVGQMRSVQNTVLKTTAVLGSLALYGFGSLVKSLISVSAKTETANLGMAIMFQSADRARGKMAPFVVSLREAASTMDLLRKAARDTPGNLEQVLSAYQAIAGAGRRSGMGQKELVDIAAQIATQDALSGTPGLVIRDVSQALRGRNDADSAVLQQSGKVPLAAKLARQGKHGESLRMLAGVLQVDPEAMKASGQSFEGRLATFEDQIDEIKRKAGAPLFKFATEELAKWSEWLDKNQEKVNRIAKRVGEGLLKAVMAVKDALVWMAEHSEDIIKWAKILVGASMLAKAASMTRDIVGGFRGLKAVLAGLAASPFWSLVAKAAAAIAGIASILDTGNHYESDSHWIDRSVPGSPLEIPNEIQPNSLAYWQYRIKAQADAGAPADPYFARGLAAAEAKMRKEASDLKNRNDMQYRSGLVYDANGQLIGQQGIAADAALAAHRAGERALGSKRAPRGAYKPRRLKKDDPYGGGKVDIDARNARITLATRLQTDDPARFADVKLKEAFTSVAAQPLSVLFGLGSPPLATGRP